MSSLLIIGTINSRYILRIIPYTKENKPYDDFTIKDHTSFWITCVTTAMILIVRTVWKKISWSFWMKHAKRQDCEELKVKCAKKAVEYSYQTVWYTFISIYGYYVIKDTPCHHYWAGGTEKNWDGLYVGLPFHDDPALFLYCLISHGEHLAALLKYIFVVERMNDYEEMLLHHVCTNILMVTSNYGSCHRYGAVILWLHDVPDIFVSIVKTSDACGYDLITLFCGYVPMCLTWLYFRLLYFPWIVYGILFYCTYPEHLSDMNGFLKTQSFFLFCLYILHVRWFMLFIDHGLRFLKTGSVEDKINHLQEAKNVVYEDQPASPPTIPATEKDAKESKKRV